MTHLDRALEARGPQQGEGNAYSKGRLERFVRVEPVIAYGYACLEVRFAGDAMVDGGDTPEIGQLPGEEGKHQRCLLHPPDRVVVHADERSEVNEEEEGPIGPPYLRGSGLCGIAMHLDKTPSLRSGLGFSLKTIEREER